MTHIVKYFMRVKYKLIYVIYTIYITNKTYFRSCTLFHISDQLRIDPTSFGGGGRGQREICKDPDICSFRVYTTRGLFHVNSRNQ